MQDLKDYTQDVHYENFRKKKLMQGSPGFVFTLTSQTRVTLFVSPSLSRKVSDYTDYTAGAGAAPDEAAKAAALQAKEKEVCFLFLLYTHIPETT